MKKFSQLSAYLIIVAVFITMVSFCVNAMAADKVIEAKIESLVFKLDKNGQPYARAIVADQFSLNGVQYTKGVPVMAFGEGNELESLKEGDTLKAIVEVNEYRGRASYNLIKLVE